jgi:hypothetical protein
LLALSRTLLAPVVLALAIAAVVAFVVVVVVRGSGSGSPPTGSRPSGSTGSSSSAPRSSVPSPRPRVHWSTVVPRLSCGGVGTVIDARAIGDLNGDRRPDAVISAHCDAGAGSPPSAVEVFLDDAGRPRSIGDVVSASDDLLVQRVGLRSGVISLKAMGYSPGTPRCCPDRTIDQTWRVRSSAGTARLVRVH